MTVPQRPPIRRDLFIGDAERDNACELLSQHFTAGRLTEPEFNERLEAAIAARTEADLHGILAQLPVLRPVPPHPAPVIVQPAQDAAGTVLDILLALVAAAAAFCLLVLLAVGGSSYAVYGMFAALGGGTVAAAITHFAHRNARNRALLRRPAPGADPPGGTP